MKSQMMVYLTLSLRRKSVGYMIMTLLPQPVLLDMASRGQHNCNYLSLHIMMTSTQIRLMNANSFFIPTLIKMHFTS